MLSKKTTHFVRQASTLTDGDFSGEPRRDDSANSKGSISYNQVQKQSTLLKTVKK